jgi:uncharacterized membrane protein SpoIIM required for sporulation
MDIDRFLADRRPHWRRLEELLELADAVPEWELGAERIQELVALYRLACSDLNQARSATANPSLLGYLNDLTGRGYRFIYRGGGRGERLAAAVRRFLAVELPAAFRRERRAVVAAGAALLLGAAVGFGAVLADARLGEELIPPLFFTESPRERVERIEGGEERIDTLEEALTFGASLYTHNIQVALLAFSLGALTLAGGYLLLFHNGVVLGAVAGMYVVDGVQLFFLAWVGPHGALELPAIVFAGAAGLVAGRALWMPGPLSRGAALRRALPTLWTMLLGTALILVVAGLIEGSFSQLSARAVPYALKVAVAAVLFAALVVYLFGTRREGE